MLKKDYKDEILKEGETYRKYNILSETGQVLFSDVHLEKAYVPFQEGDNFGAKDINDVTTLVDISDETKNMYERLGMINA